MHTPTRIPPLAGLAAFCLCSLAPGEWPPATLETITLERFEVTGLPIEDSVNPLIRPVEGVFGDVRSILDTPRSFSTINQELMRERGINGVAEFVPYAPGTSSVASYGKATIPNIRGDLAETFLNGQRRSYNNFGFFPSFNGVEAVDVVRGPGSAIYGSGFLTGGYVNYVTKRPKFIAETSITTRLGTWVPDGGSWFNASWQLDTTAPTADGKSAWRFSYEGRKDETFFHRNGGRDDRQDFFVSWLRRGSDRLTLEGNAQFMWQASPQLLGVNRPNQDLIDHGTYYTGDLPDLYSPITGAIGGTIGGVASVTIPRDATLFSRGDFSNANIAHAQFIATLQLPPSQKLINRTLLEHVHRRRYHAFEYAEYVTQWTAENRTEWHARHDSATATHQTIAGLTLRAEQRESYTNYFNEYFFQYDITRPNRFFSHADQYANSYFPGFTGPGGRQFFPAAYGSPETADSLLFNPTLFLQHEAKWREKLTLLGGLRLDGFFARAEDPLPGDTTQWRDRHRDNALSWNASASYALSPRASVYATYQRAYAVHGNVTGGGIMLKDDGTGEGVIDPDDFTNLSRLAEVGAKLALADNALYAGFALYEQRRGEVELGGDVKNLRMRGAELELVYQPSVRTNATFNVALNDARFDNSSASQAGGTSLFDLYARGRGPGGRGTGVGFTWDKLPEGNYRIPGLSRWVVNGSFSHRGASGFGAGVSGSWQSEQSGNLLNEYHLPPQLTLNAFVFYRAARWEANIDVLNVANERNWIHNGDNYSNNVLIFQDLPRRVEGYVKFKF
jgi:outer membrane receptor protein involved in Fe transport